MVLCFKAPFLFKIVEGASRAEDLQINVLSVKTDGLGVYLYNPYITSGYIVGSRKFVYRHEHGDSEYSIPSICCGGYSSFFLYSVRKPNEQGARLLIQEFIQKAMNKWEQRIELRKIWFCSAGGRSWV